MFDLKGLGVLSVASGSPPGAHSRFTMWLYRSEADGLSEIGEAGYFDAMAERLRPGDLILVSSVTGLHVSAAVLHVCGADDEVEVETLTPNGMLVPPPLLPPQVLEAGFYVSVGEDEA